MIDVPVYLSSRPREDQPARVWQLSGGQIVWSRDLPNEVGLQSALLGLGDLWLTLCPVNTVIAAQVCETWRLESQTGRTLKIWPGELWSAQAEAVVIVSQRSRSVDALDSFYFQAKVVRVGGERDVSGQVDLRPKCGQFDVLGLRGMDAVLKLSLSDGCGIWVKSFRPR